MQNIIRVIMVTIWRLQSEFPKAKQKKAILLSRETSVSHETFFCIIGNIDFLLYKKGECRGDTPLPIKEGAVPKGTKPFYPKLAWLGKTDSRERSESEVKPLGSIAEWLSHIFYNRNIEFL